MLDCQQDIARDFIHSFLPPQVYPDLQERAGFGGNSTNWVNEYARVVGSLPELGPNMPQSVLSRAPTAGYGLLV